MSDTARIYTLLSDTDRHYAIAAIQSAPVGKQVTIDDPPRSNEANKRMWSMLTAIAKSDLRFDGEKLSANAWKEILGSAWLKQRGQWTGSVRKGLEGEPVMLGGFSSRKLRSKEFAEFSESIEAFLRTNGVEWAEEAPPPDGQT